MKQTIKFGVLLRTAFGCIHGPISAATTHIGSSCASTGDQSRLDHALVTGLGQSIAGPVSYPKPWPKTNHTTVLRCRYCYGEVVIHSTNGHLVLITRLLSL